MKSEVLEKVKKLLLEEENILIASMDQDLYPSVMQIDNLKILNHFIYFTLEKNHDLLKHIKKNKKVSIYLKTKSNVEMIIKSKLKILGKQKSKEFIEENQLKNLENEIIKLKKCSVIITDLTTEKVDHYAYKAWNKGDILYQINNSCKTCNKCFKACPVNAIEKGKKQYIIDPSKCIGCGKCFKVCPHNAIDKLNKV